MTTPIDADGEHDHRFTTEQIRDAIETHDPGEHRPNDETYHEALDAVQSHLAQELGSYLGRARPHYEGDIELVVEARNAVLFATGEGEQVWRSICDNAGIRDEVLIDVVRQVHANFGAESRAFDIDPDVTDHVHDLDEMAPILIVKPKAWANAERAMEERLRFVFKHGVTPAQEIDRWLTRARGMTQVEAAYFREKDQSTISANVTRAEDTLDEVEPATSESSSSNWAVEMDG